MTRARAVVSTVVIAAALLATGAGLARAQVCPVFRAPSYQIGTPDFPTGTVAVDLNGDGVADLVSGLSGFNGSLGIALAAGGGLFHPYRGYFAGHGTLAVAVGDFDGDGRVDIGGATHVRLGPGTGINGVLVAFGDGNGGIADSAFASMSVAPSTAVAGDLNGDGRADLVVALADSDSIVVYLGDADRALHFVGEYGMPNPVTGLAIGDVNGDGIPDVVVSGIESVGSAYFTGLGNGALGALVDLPGQPYASFLALAPIDAQPGLDLVSADPGMNFSGNLGGGSFAAPSALPGSAGGFGLSILDVDRDGKLDIVTATTVNRSLLAWRGDGQGGFGPRIDSRVSFAIPGNSTAGDFDGDGLPDASYDASLFPYVVWAHGNGDGSFGSKYPPMISENLGSVALGDFDGDGKLDAVASSSSHLQLVFAHGNGDGSLGALAIGAAQPHAYSYLVAGQFDADNKLDLVGVATSPPALSFLRGHGDGTFDQAVDFTLGATPKAPTLVDLDHDGRMDVVVPCAGTSTLYVFMGGPSGPTGPTLSTVPAGPVAVRYSDLDGDSRLDRVIACTNQLVTQLDDGAGGYTTVQSVSESPTPGDLALADCDGDGVLDAFVSAGAPTGSVPPAAVHVLRGHPGGTFDSETNTSLDWWLPGSAPGTARPGIGNLFALDVDGDGRLDLVASDANNRSAAIVARGHGDGTFGAPEAYGTGCVGRIAIGDLDGDGRPDIVQAGQGGSPSSGPASIIPLRNQSAGVVAVGPAPIRPGAGVALALSRVAPNPSAGRFAFTLTAARAGTARLALYSPAGREVYARGPVALVAGANQLTLDAATTRLPAGVYWLRAASGAGAAATKVVLLGR